MNDNEPDEEAQVNLRYSPAPSLLSAISTLLPNWGGMSLEAFLQYNDILAWNEDCKYYYIMREVKHQNAWINDTGRINTILTHIRILGLIMGEVKPSTVMTGFYQRRGVSPADKEEITRITGGLVHA